MFYRSKFDNVISSILHSAGYTTISQKLAVWPAGLSAELISQGKQLGIDAKSAAYIGFTKYVVENNEIPENASNKGVLLNCAATLAKQDQDLDSTVFAKIKSELNNLGFDVSTRSALPQPLLSKEVQKIMNELGIGDD